MDVILFRDEQKSKEKTRMDVILFVKVKVVKLGGSKAGRVEISPTMGKTRTLTHLKPKCHHDIKSRDKVNRNHVSSGQVFCNPEVKQPHLPLRLMF